MRPRPRRQSREILGDANKKDCISIKMVQKFIFKSPNRPTFECTLKSQRCIGKVNARSRKSRERSTGRCKRRVVMGLQLCPTHLKSDAHLEIKPSTIAGAGSGVFAYNHDAETEIVFKPMQRISEYKGELITGKQLNERYGNFTAPYGMELSPDRFIDSACVRSYSSMVNHAPAKKSNARFSLSGDRKHVYLVATKRIRHGDEILINYGRSYKFNDPTEHMTVKRSRSKKRSKRRST